MEYNKKREWEEKNNIKVVFGRIGSKNKENAKMTLSEAIQRISSDKIEDIGKEPGE